MLSTHSRSFSFPSHRYSAGSGYGSNDGTDVGTCSKHIVDLNGQVSQHYELGQQHALGSSISFTLLSAADDATPFNG